MWVVASWETIIALSSYMLQQERRKTQRIRKSRAYQVEAREILLNDGSMGWLIRTSLPRKWGWMAKVDNKDSDKEPENQSVSDHVNCLTIKAVLQHMQMMTLHQTLTYQIVGSTTKKSISTPNLQNCSPSSEVIAFENSTTMDSNLYSG